MKNLKVNKKLLSLIIAGGLTLFSTGVAYAGELSTDSMSINDAMSKVSNESVIDEVFDYVDVYMVDSDTYKGDLVDLDDAANYLEDLVESKKDVSYGNNKEYIDNEIRTNGVKVAISLLDGSIKSRFLDQYDNNYFNVGKVNVNDTINYNNKEYVDETGSIELLKDLKEIKNNEKATDDEVFSLVNKALSTSKNIIYNGVEVENNKVKVK